MLPISRPMGRLPFAFGISALNAAILLAVTISLASLPVGAAHAAVLVVVGGLQALWTVLHARRFADAGRGLGWPLAVGAACFAIFAVGYFVVAAIWAVPEVQQEAFRTAGGIGGNLAGHVETNPLLVEAGRAIASAIGVAGALVVSGLVFLVFTVAVLAAGVFSLVALALPRASALPSTALGRRGQLPRWVR